MVVAGADTPQEFAGDSSTVQAQQQQAKAEGKHPAEVPGTLTRGEDPSEALGVAGPALQLNTLDLENGIWQGSVLYLTKQGISPKLQLQTMVCWPVASARWFSQT